MRAIKAIAKVTFLELVRDKILYNVLLVASLLFGAAYLASQLSRFLEGRIILDFGLAAVTMSSALIGVLGGANLLTREFERKTYMLALSRPVRPTVFVAGKFFGLAGVITVNTALLSAVLLGMLGLLGNGLISGTLGSALLFSWVQSLLLAAIAILISSYSTASVAVMLSIGLYLIGINLSTLGALAKKHGPGLAGSLLDGLTYLLPNYEFFSLGSQVTYQLPVTEGTILSAVAYGAAWIAVSLAAAGCLIQYRRE